MDTVYIKYIQGGGSSEAVNYAIECYKDRTVLFVVDNLDVQLNQVKERLIALGVPPEFIYCKTRIKQYRIGTPGILIVNKHPSNLNAAIHAISSVRENNLLILDEPDRDAVGHQDSDKIPKDKLVNKLREAGVSLQKIRIALSNVNEILGKNMKITDISIFSDGHSIYVITDNNEMLDLLRKGQAVFGISLGPVHTETEAEIFSLYPEKISVNNA